MNILSLFDGISCARVALERTGLPVKTYYASEIDKHAITVSTKNHPDIIRLGDVRNITADSLPPIDLLIGGSPCQDLSIAKKDRKGLGGERSGLFWDYVRLKNELNPTYFILENVASMPKADKDIITGALGVEPVLFNASLVSAQSRKRLFWTNLQFTLPEDRNILLKDILQENVDDRFTISGKVFTQSPASTNAITKVGYIGEGTQYGQGGQAHRVYSTEGKTPTLSSSSPLIKLGHIGTNDSQTNRVYSPDGKAPTQCKGPGGGALPTLIKLGHIGTTDGQANRVYDPTGKSVTLSANGGGLGAKTGLYQQNEIIRKLTPIECERLQGLPDTYTEGIATTNRYKCLGNAFNVDVVAHILASIPKTSP